MKFLELKEGNYETRCSQNGQYIAVKTAAKRELVVNPVGVVEISSCQCKSHSALASRRLTSPNSKVCVQVKSLQLRFMNTSTCVSSSTWGGPGVVVFPSNSDEEVGFGVNKFNPAPAGLDGIQRVDNQHALVVKYHFWFDEYQPGCNEQASAQEQKAIFECFQESCQGQACRQKYAKHGKSDCTSRSKYLFFHDLNSSVVPIMKAKANQ